MYKFILLFTLAFEAFFMCNARPQSQIQTQIEQIVSQVPLGPQLSEAASQAASVANTIGAGLFPVFFPVPNTEKKSEAAETPASTRTLIHLDPRPYYSIASPAQVIDYVQVPVILTPLHTIRARSLTPDQQGNILAVPLPEVKKPEALPLQDAKLDASNAEKSEKKSAIGRCLESNTLKEDSKEDSKKEEKEKEELKPLAEPDLKKDLAQPQLKAAEVHDLFKAVGVVNDIVPQSKVV
ncbi:uncharacterized protein LOC119672765 [Teleopsis dalmanni]|uniref:uncharacterized protein LOC119672765 n=1 Tax=Teleopsis dalmanni TaxID=139649 RepID=UPI0018CE6359|nr:uncharacterized protein LOC119672765 [Teleopsis dalmanni]XP_037939821.1 uncharacterized protein LOC119672765 [Teleopsis dalmanni]